MLLRSGAAIRESLATVRRAISRAPPEEPPQKPSALVETRRYRNDEHTGIRSLLTIHYAEGEVKTAFYEGEAPNEAKRCEHRRNGDYVYFLGKQGHERAARLDDGNFNYYYVGDKGEERLYKKCPTKERGTRCYYEGPPKRERLVREEGSYIWHYRGARGREYMVSRHELGEGAVDYFEGKKRGDERLVKRVFPWGKEIRFHGRAGHESVWSVHWPEEGLEHIYSGNKGEERLVETKRADGTRQIFKGPRRQERKVRTVLPLRCGADGRARGSTVLRWRGERGEEKLLWRKRLDPETATWVEECALKPGSSIWSTDVRRFLPAPGALPMCNVHFSNGAYVTYRDTGDDECLVQMRTGDGRVTYYWGEAGEERKGRTEVQGMAGLATVLGPAAPLPDPEFDGLNDRTDHNRVASSTNTIYYEGVQGEERIHRIECCNGGTYWLEGPQGRESVKGVRSDWGMVTTFTGSRHNERIVKREFPEGITTADGVRSYAQWLEGEPGEERIVRSTSSITNESGASHSVTNFFDGPAGRERKVWSLHPDHTMEYFVGQRGEERMVVEVRADGSARHYQGERGEERLVHNVVGSVAPPPPQVSATCNAGVKRKLGQAFAFLEELSADNHCNEHAYNEMGKKLRDVYSACDDDRGGEAD